MTFKEFLFGSGMDFLHLKKNHLFLGNGFIEWILLINGLIFWIFFKNAVWMLLGIIWIENFFFNWVGVKFWSNKNEK